MPGVQELLVKRKFMLDKYFTLEDQEFEVMKDGVKKMASRPFYYSHNISGNISPQKLRGRGANL